MSALNARLRKTEAALGVGETARREALLHEIIGDMSDEEFARKFHVHEHRAFVEREAAVRGMTPEALEREIWDHLFDANYPEPVFTNGRYEWPAWRTRNGRDPWER